MVEIDNHANSELIVEYFDGDSITDDDNAIEVSIPPEGDLDRTITVDPDNDSFYLSYDNETFTEGEALLGREAENCNQ